MRISQKLLILQLICHLISIPALVYVFMTGQYYLLLISIINYAIIMIVIHNITLHRLFSHRSFKTHPIIEKFLCYFSVIGTIGPPISYVAVHRIHHATSDTNKDPHTFYKNKKVNWKRALEIWFIYDWKVNSYAGKYVKDLMRDPDQKFVYDHYFKLLFCYLAFLAFLNPILLIYFYALPLSFVLHSTGFINVLGHYHGYRNYETNDHSTNSWLAALLAFGDGWHNNHHAKPYKWNMGEKWWEIDVSSWVIRLIRIKEN